MDPAALLLALAMTSLASLSEKALTTTVLVRPAGRRVAPRWGAATETREDERLRAIVRGGGVSGVRGAGGPSCVCMWVYARYAFELCKGEGARQHIYRRRCRFVPDFVHPQQADDAASAGPRHRLLHPPLHPPLLAVGSDTLGTTVTPCCCVLSLASAGGSAGRVYADLIRAHVPVRGEPGKAVVMHPNTVHEGGEGVEGPCTPTSCRA